MLIKKYTTEWIKNFTEIKREIESGLNSIKYVGSISVPLLDSKGIIDFDIICNSKSELEQTKAGLIEVGFCYNGNQGITQREVIKRTGQLNNKILDRVQNHLYVCPSDSKALGRYILTLNFLRNNDWARLKYQEIKYDLVEKAN